jgi:hypothetical protein
MKVKILRQPNGTVSGVALDRFRPDKVYDLPATLAEYLVLEQFAILEMRDRDRPRAGALRAQTHSVAK